MAERRKDRLDEEERADRDEAMDWFYLFALGSLIVISGIALGLNLIGMPPFWIVVLCLVLLVVAAVVMLMPPRKRGQRT